MRANESGKSGRLRWISRKASAGSRSAHGNNVHYTYDVVVGPSKFDKIRLHRVVVPAETTDFNFMKAWGVVKDSQHATIAFGLARGIRGFSGQGFGPLISSGSATAPGIGHLVRVLLKSQVAGSWVRMDVSEHSINSAAAAACSSELGGASLEAMHLVKR